MLYRKGEEEQTRFRAKRIFSVGEEFYSNTREGATVGPYPSEKSAERGVELYVKCILNKDSSGEYATKIAMQGLWASTNFS